MSLFILASTHTCKKLKPPSPDVATVCTHLEKVFPGHIFYIVARESKFLVLEQLAPFPDGKGKARQATHARKVLP
jgi:hypothetical protein